MVDSSLPHNIITKQLAKYDHTLEGNISMYDRISYQRDCDLCNSDSITLVSGNLIKGYRYKYLMEPYLLDNMDASMESKLNSLREKQ